MCSEKGYSQISLTVIKNRPKHSVLGSVLTLIQSKDKLSLLIQPPLACVRNKATQAFFITFLFNDLKSESTT